MGYEIMIQDTRPSTLSTRILSALVIAPPVLAAIHFGSPYVQVLILLAGAIAAWEWARVCGGGTLGGAGMLAVGGVVGALAAGLLAIGAVVGALAAGLLGSYVAAAALLCAGALATSLWAARRNPKAGLWLAVGVVYLPIAYFAFAWLRLVPEDGRAIAYWLLATVWATDTGAYAAGRGLGGPKLAPAISPKKTWAGLAGGAASAAVVGVVAAGLWQGPEAWVLAAAGTGLAIVAQAGDLFVSLWKRRFGVKDASRLIPGHGGLLDRVDGLLAASLAVSAYFWIATT